MISSSVTFGDTFSAREGLESKTRLTFFSVVLNGEITGAKNPAENLFSLPICVIMEPTKSLPPRGRWHGVAVTEGACVTLGLN